MCLSWPNDSWKNSTQEKQRSEIPQTLQFSETRQNNYRISMIYTRSRARTGKRQFIAFCVLFLVCSQISWYVDAEVSSSFPQLITKDLGIRYFSVKRGYRLRGKTTRSIEVHNTFACLRHCMKDSCTALNFQEKTRTNGIHSCEILSKVSPSELENALISDSSFNFISLQVMLYSYLFLFCFYLI